MGEGFYWLVLFGLLFFFGGLAFKIHKYEGDHKHEERMKELEIKEKRNKSDKP